MKSFKNYWALLLLPLAISCEGTFPGNRPNMPTVAAQTVLNNPLQMKKVDVAGGNYLAVVNINSSLNYSGGSINFYTLNDPPVRAPIDAVPVPSGVLDFVIENGTTLYVADRKEDKSAILVYELNAAHTGFFPKIDPATDKPMSIVVAQNPTRLGVFTRTSDGKRIMAVLSKAKGLIHFIQLSDNSFIAPTDPTITTARAGRPPDALTTSSLVGGAFYMRARQTNGSTDDLITVGSGAQGGEINGQLGILFGAGGGVNPFIITTSLIENAIYAFRFDTYENNSNIVWDLGTFRVGGAVAGQSRVGTGEMGFRGLAIDGADNIYMSSVTDNSLYKIAAGLMTQAKSIDRNTTGYPHDNQANLMASGFDTDVVTDAIFPRLGDIALDCEADSNNTRTCNGAPGGAATQIFALGEGQDGLSNGTIYKVSAAGTILVRVDVGYQLPQKVLYVSDNGGRVFVSIPGSNSIKIYDTNLTKAGDFPN